MKRRPELDATDPHALAIHLRDALRENQITRAFMASVSMVPFGQCLMCKGRGIVIDGVINIKCGKCGSIGFQEFEHTALIRRTFRTILDYIERNRCKRKISYHNILPPKDCRVQGTCSGCGFDETLALENYNPSYTESTRFLVEAQHHLEDLHYAGSAESRAMALTVSEMARRLPNPNPFKAKMKTVILFEEIDGPNAKETQTIYIPEPEHALQIYIDGLVLGMGYHSWWPWLKSKIQRIPTGTLYNPNLTTDITDPPIRIGNAIIRRKPDPVLIGTTPKGGSPILECGEKCPPYLPSLSKKPKKTGSSATDPGNVANTEG